MTSPLRQPFRAGAFQANLAAQLRMILETIERDPSRGAHLLRDVVGGLCRADEKGWRFVMINPTRYAELVGYLLQHSRRPKVAVLLLLEIMARVRPDSQEIDGTRQELASAVEATPDHVSVCLTELANLGAIRRERDGPYVRITLNPWLGTHIPLAESDRLRDEWPDLAMPHRDKAQPVRV